MTSTREDVGTHTAYQAGITVRSLLLGRLYANRFLIENDEASRARAIREFRDVDLNYIKLEAELENPKRKALAKEAQESQLAYLQAFDTVHRTIVRRNNLIRYELDRMREVVAYINRL